MCTNGCQDPYELPTGALGPAGADGIQGLTGAAGATGPAGIAGSNGVDGNDGSDGTSGNDGTQGTSFRQGAGSPSSSLGNQDDTYVNLTSSDLRIYTKTLLSQNGDVFWEDTGVGLKGDTGAAGNDGADGSDGSDAGGYIERGFTVASKGVSTADTELVETQSGSVGDISIGNLNQNATRVLVTFSARVVHPGSGGSSTGLTFNLHKGLSGTTTIKYALSQTVFTDGRSNIVSFSYMDDTFLGASGAYYAVVADLGADTCIVEDISLTVTSNSPF